MAGTASRDAYFETGLDVLASAGYGALKLSEVCRRMGVTTGSFYHFFKNWASYTEQLPEYWFDSRTRLDVAELRAESDPDKRIDRLLEYGLALPHGAEGAIRTWGSIDTDVRVVVERVDRQRYDLVYEVVADLLDLGPERAHRYASWALFLLIGYEQTTLPRDVGVLAWTAEQLAAALRNESATTSSPTTPRPAEPRRRNR
jgi:AcrR family transcriptional regulator